MLPSRNLCRLFYVIHSEMVGLQRRIKDHHRSTTNRMKSVIRKSDNEGNVKITQRRIRRIAGTFLTNVGIGTIVWKIENDLGQSHGI